MHDRRSWLAAAAAWPCLLLGGRVAAQSTAAQQPAGAQHRLWPKGRKTPPMRLPVWGGSVFDLAEAKGQVVVLNFWASWCEPCLAELPSLEQLAGRHASDKLQVQAVNYRETDNAIRRFLAQSPTKLSILRDADGGAAKAWQVRIFPTTVVIGRNGRAAFTVTGEVDWGSEMARQWMNSVL